MGNPFLGAIKTTFFNIRQYHRRLYIKCHRISLQEACNFSTCLAAHLPGEAPYLLHRAADYLVDMADGLWHKQPLLPIGRCDHRSLKNGEEKKMLKNMLSPDSLQAIFSWPCCGSWTSSCAARRPTFQSRDSAKKCFAALSCFPCVFPLLLLVQALLHWCNVFFPWLRIPMQLSCNKNNFLLSNWLIFVQGGRCGRSTKLQPTFGAKVGCPLMRLCVSPHKPSAVELLAS